MLRRNFSPLATSTTSLDRFLAFCDSPRMPLRRALSLLLFAVAPCVLGCTTTPNQMWESLKGDGFTGWSGDFASGVRNNKDAKPSGFFTDRRSEQIEKDLGGF